MRRSWSTLITALGVLTATVGAAPATTVGAASSGPLLTEAADVLASALHCPASFSGAHEPVLLVHATAETPERNFANNYARVLPKLGYDVCTVELVDLARGDIQESAERTVYAIRTIAERSHSKVQVIGHSEGPLPVRWAIKYWPDTRLLVDDLISIAGPHHGWLLTDVFCAAGCVPALWQMRRSSRFMAAFNSGDETPGPVSYTSIYSVTDELVQPYQTAELRGGANIKVQDVCPGRVTEHYEEVYDAAVYGVVLDALTHRGPADLSRVDRSLCRQLTMPGTTIADLLAGEAGGWVVGTPLLGEHHVDQEPPLASYANGGA